MDGPRLDESATMSGKGHGVSSVERGERGEEARKPTRAAPTVRVLMFGLGGEPRTPPPREATRPSPHERSTSEAGDVVGRNSKAP